MVEAGTQLGTCRHPSPNSGGWGQGQEKIPESNRTGRLAEESVKLTSTEKQLGGGVCGEARGERQKVRAGTSSQDAGHPSLATPCRHLQCLLGNGDPGLFQTQGAPFWGERVFVLARVVTEKPAPSREVGK